MENNLPKKKSPKKKTVDEFIRSALGSTKREPGWEYGSVLPVRVKKDNKKKEIEWGLGYSDTAKSMLDAITLPRRAMKGERVTPEQAMEMAMSITAPGVASARYVPGMVNMPTVYHGTPHKFEPTPENPLGEFRASQIGTGEGAQAYGHGIYLAENPEVAKGYKSTINNIAPYEIDGRSYHGTTSRNDAQIGDYAANALQRFDGNKKEAIKWLKNNGSPYEIKAAQMLRNATSIKPLTGSLYTADLPDEMIDRMLDWDKPLSEQPEVVRKALKDISSPEIKNGMSLAGGGNLRVTESVTGEPKYFLEMGGGSFRLTEKEVQNLVGSGVEGKSIYQSLFDKFGGQKAASEYLASIGIPGIKYLDAGSRRRGGEGTLNYVLFPGEEKKAKILKRE